MTGETCPCKVFVNHYGWICGGSLETGLKFTRYRAGAKTFDEYGKELLETRIYIENKLQCHYDLYRH